MICNNCGNKISNDSKFCNKCGHNVTVESSSLENNFDEHNTSNNSFTNVENVSNESTNQQDYNTQNSHQPVKTKNNNVKNIIIIAVIIIACVGIIAFLVNKIMFKGEADTSSDTNITTDILTEGTSNDEINLTKTYTNKEENISFNYPKSWQILEPEQEIPDVIVSLTSLQDENFLVNMHIAKTDTSTYINYFNNKEKVPELYALDGSEVREVASTKIDNVDAIKVISDAVDNSTGIQYFYNFNNTGYVITLYASTDNFDEYEPIFDSIMESYKITAIIEDTSTTEDTTPIEDITLTEDEAQNQTTKYDGLSEAEALAEVQKFINTYPLLELEITGYVEHKPQIDTFSTKGAYGVEVVAPDGSHYSLLVDKTTGNVFISSNGGTIVYVEEVYKKLYDELFVSNQNDNVILFNGKKIANYLGASMSSIGDDFGPILGETDIELLTNEATRQRDYQDIGFMFNTDLIIDCISGNPEKFTYNGVTLDKNSDELANLIGEPIIDTKIYSNTYGTYVYCIEYFVDDYTLRFTFKDKDSDAYQISFIR